MRNPAILCLSVPAFLLAGALHAAEPVAVRGLAAACFNCHGVNGMAEPGMARLAGRPRAQLLQSLLGFKSGTQAGTIMPQMARGYSDEQLTQLADYFARQRDGAAP